MTDHYREAEVALESADNVAYSEGYPNAWDLGPGGRQAVVYVHLARAQVHASLALADAITEASNA